MPASWVPKVLLWALKLAVHGTPEGEPEGLGRPEPLSELATLRLCSWASMGSPQGQRRAPEGTCVGLHDAGRQVNR